MKNRILGIMIFSFFSVFPQQNQKVDSLHKEVIKLEKKIKELKSKITEEVQENGYFIEVRKKYQYSTINLKRKIGSKTIAIIPNGSIIRIINKKQYHFKVEYNGLTG